jgi:hypothetical protein
MTKLTEALEYFYDDKLLVEMANLQPKTTGVEHTINIVSRGGAKHGARVKVSNVAGKYAHDDNFSLTLEPEPRVVGTCKLKKEHLENIKDWVRLNHEHINKVWGDDGSMDIDDVSVGFKKL